MNDPEHAYHKNWRSRYGPVRVDVLRRATHTSDRVGTLASFAKGRATLDVGCVDFRPGIGYSESGLEKHRRIAADASEHMGLDLDSAGVAELVRRGYPAQVGDVCTCKLGRKFRTIIAGEVIEHLPNPADFFHNMRRHLEEDGRLVITTCNPFNPRRFWKILRHGHCAVHPEHTMWFDPLTIMRLGTMCHFEPLELIWVREGKRFDLRLIPQAFRAFFNPNFIVVFRPTGRGGASADEA